MSNEAAGNEEKAWWYLRIQPMVAVWAVVKKFLETVVEMVGLEGCIGTSAFRV